MAVFTKINNKLKLSIKIIKIESNISINYFMELKNCCRKGFNEQKHLRNQK